MNETDDIVFLQNDQAGAEALIVAYLCTAGRLRELFNYGIKPHTYVAMHLFVEVWKARMNCNDIPINSPIAEIKNWSRWKELEKHIKESDNDIPSKRFYYFAKQTCHSANYGIKAPTFVMNVLDKSEGQVVIPLVEGQRFLSVYHNLFPEIQNWHAEIQARLKATRELKNLFGFPRYFHGMLTDQSFKEAYAFIPQSTVGCITHLAAEKLQRLLDGGTRDDFAVMQNNHDSLLVQCFKSKHLEIARLMTEAMNCPLVNERGERFQMRSEVGMGYNWKDIKEIKL